MVDLIMMALYYDKNLKLKKVPTPRVAGEVRVKVRYAGVCRTDLEIIKGYMNFKGIPGHEFTGIALNGKWKGERVSGEINVGCGRCDWCLKGLERHCPERTVLGIKDRNGSFAEYLTLPEKNLHRIPDSLPDEITVFTEPVAAALEIHEQVNIKPNSKIAIIGDGRLAQLIARVLLLTGCRIFVFGKHKKKMKLFVDMDLVVIPSFSLINDKFETVIECSGREEGLYKAIEIVEPRGTIIIKSTYNGTVQLDLSLLVINEVELIGSRCGPFGPALKLLKDGLIDVEPLIMHTFPLSKGLEAFHLAQKPGILKVLLKNDY